MAADPMYIERIADFLSHMFLGEFSGGINVNMTESKVAEKKKNKLTDRILN